MCAFVCFGLLCLHKIALFEHVIQLTLVVVFTSLYIVNVFWRKVKAFIEKRMKFVVELVAELFYCYWANDTANATTTTSNQGQLS